MTRFGLILKCLLAVLLSGAGANRALAEQQEFTIAGVPLLLEEVTTNSAVYFTSMRLNRAANVWNVEVSISNRSSGPLNGPLVLLVNSATGISGVQGSDGSAAGKPFFDMSGQLDGGGLDSGETSAKRTLTLGRGTGTPIVTTRVYALPAPDLNLAAALVRTLDSAGQPLGEVTIEESGPGGSEQRRSDGSYGVAALGGDPGEYFWRFSRADYFPVWRQKSLGTGNVDRVVYPRLTPKSTNTVSITPLGGGSISNSAVVLTFPAGAVTANATVSVTPLTGQTLPALLPYGWSPLQAFWFETSGPLSVPASARIALWDALASTETAALAEWNTNLLRWDVLALIPGSKTNSVTVPVPGGGAYAIVVPDSGAFAPPPAQSGQPLSAITFSPPDAAVLAAAGQVIPDSSPASLVPELVTGTASLLISNRTGPLPSGFALPSRIHETYRFRTTAARGTPDYDQFIVGYQRPGDSLPETLHATFPVRPLRLFSAEVLDEAVVNVDILPPGSLEGTMLSTNGGLLGAGDSRLLAGGGTVEGPAAAALYELADTNFADLTGEMFLVDAFDLTLSDLRGGRLTLQLKQPPPNAYLVVARVIDRDGVYGLEPVERLSSDAQGRLVSWETNATSRLGGIDRSGQYLVLQVAGPQTVIQGIARNAQGQPAGGLWAQAGPWSTFSRAPNGEFKLIAPGGDLSVMVRNLATGDAGQTSLTIAAGQELASVTANAAVVGPSVVAVSPTNNAVAVPRVAAVSVRFNKPVNPATLLNGGLQLLTTNGLLVASSVTLNLANTTATLLPAATLDPATEFRIALAGTVADANGNPLEGQREFRFSTVGLPARDPAAQLIIYQPGATNVPETVRASIPAYVPGSNSTEIVVRGTPGVADPGVAVILLNESSGETATVLSKPDGSFASVINGTEEDFVSAVFVSLNGERIYVPVSRQEFDDGFVGLYRSGGILEAQSDGGPVQVYVEPEAITTKAKLRIKVPSASEVAELLGDTEPESAAMLSKPLIFEAETDPMQAPIKVRFSVNLASVGFPQDADPKRAAIALAKVVNEDGVKAFEVLDQMKFTPNDEASPLRGVPIQKSGLPRKSDAEQRLFGVVDSVIGLVPGAGIANNVFRYVLMPILIGGDPIVVKGKVYVAPEAVQIFNPLRIQNETAAALFGGFSYSMLGKAFGNLDTFSFAIDFANEAVQEVNDLTLGHALGGAFITLQNIETPSVPGRLRPGMVYATSQQDGSYLMVAPTTPWIEIKPTDFYLLIGTHPRFSDRVPQPLLALTDISTAGVVFKDFVFREPLAIQTAPTVNIAHRPAFPAPGQDVELQVNATQGFQGQPEVKVFVTAVNATTNVPLTAIQFSNVVTTSLGPNRTRWSGVIKAPDSVLAVQLGVSTFSSAGVSAQSLRHRIDFTGEPELDEGTIPPSDPTNKRGPAVVATFPGEGGFSDASGQVTILFNEPIDRSVERNASGITLLGPGDALHPAIRLSEDQTALTLQYGGLMPDADYTLTLSGLSILDLNGNPLNQSADQSELVSFTLNFRTPPVARYALPGVVNGVGAAVSGAHAYVIDHTTPPVLRTYDISKPEHPVLLSSARVVGTPRDLVVIPNYGFKPNLNAPAQTNDLVVVVGGDLDAIIEDLDGDHKGDNVITKGQYLRVFDMANPSSPVELAAPILTYRVSSVAAKVRWFPPYLVYQEYGQDAQLLGFVHLQEMLIGFGATRAEGDRFPDAGREGKDLDGNGDYIGPGEVLPLPMKRPPEFYGKKQNYVVAGSTQKILDFSVAPGPIVGVTLTRGLALSQGGQTTSTRVPPQYRTLAFNEFGIDPSRGSVGFTDLDYPSRVTILDGLQIEYEGRLQTPTVALVSLSPDRHGTHTLAVLDITIPESPKRIGEVVFPDDITGGGIKSVQWLPDGRLELTTASHVIYLNPRLLASEAPPEGQLHPAIVGFIPSGGGRLRSVGSSDFGVRVVAEGGRNEIVQSAPQFSFIHFPDAANVIDPRSLDHSAAGLAQLMSGARQVPGLYPARVRADHLGHDSDLTPPNPAMHFHVLVEASGGAGPEIKLGLEALSYAGVPLPNKGAGFPPVRAVDPLTMNALGMNRRPDCDAPVRALTAYRLSNDPGSPLFNRYLSRPFVVVSESVSIDELADLNRVADREVLWSGAMMRAFIETTDFGRDTIGPFAAQVDARKSRLRPPAYGIARTLDVGYVMGPNPPPPGGAQAMDGTYGSVSSHSGEFRTEATDMGLPSPRMPIEITRTIGAQDTYEGPFGMGWDFNYNERLTELTPQLFPPGLEMPMIARAEEADSVVAASRDVLFSTGSGRLVLFQWKGEDMPVEFSADPLVEELGYEDLVSDYYLPEHGVFDLLVRFKDGTFERLTPDGMRYRYAVNGRLETITDRFPKNRHELSYDLNGWLRRIDDRSVTTERYVEFGYYRPDDDGEFVNGLDERTTNPFWLGKVCRLRDFAGRDVVYTYNDEGLLIRRDGIQVGGENGGYSGRTQTHYIYEKCRIVGVAVGESKTPLVAGPTAPGKLDVPVMQSAVGSGLQTKITVPDDLSAENLENKKTSTEQGDGRVTEVTLDKFGNPTTTRVSGPGIDPAELKQIPDENGLVTYIQYPEGRVQHFTYDTNNPVFRSRGNLLRMEVDPGPRGGDAYVETYNYDPRYNLPSGAHKDANQFTITYTLSSDGRFVQSIRHDTAGTETFGYNEHGQLETHVGVDGTESATAYDSSSGFVKTTRSGNYTTTYGYGGDVASEMGRPSSITPPRGAPATMKYNANLQEVEVKRGASLQQMAYDEQGRMSYRHEVLGGGKELDTQWDIDAKGFVMSRKMSGVEVDGTETTLEFIYTPDELSRIHKIQHPGGTVQEFDYDALGHMTKMTLEGSYVEEYKPDRHGNILEVKKGGDLVMSTAYDGLDRPTTMTAYTGTRQYVTEQTYFAGGQLKTRRTTDPGFGVVEDRVVNQIDAMGRAVSTTVNGDSVSRSETFSYGALERSVTGPFETVTEKWNAAGYPTERKDSISTSTFTPDENGNVETILRAEDGAAYTDTFAYDDLDHRKSASDGAGLVAAFTPRADGYNTEVKNARGNATTFDYSALGEPLSRHRADGMEFRFRHDEQRQTSFSGDTSKGFDYEYDKLFRLTHRSQRDGSEFVYQQFDARNKPQTLTIPGGAIKLTYDLQERGITSQASFGSATYESSSELDALNRVRVASYQQESSGANRATYTYDKAGPLVSARFEEDGGDFTVRYGYRNDLGRNRITYPSGMVITETRDNSGRLTGISSSIDTIATIVDWQGNQQPKTVDLGGVLRIQNVYDGRGRLVGSRSARNPGGALQAELRYQYDGANNVEMRQFIHRAGKTDNFSYDSGERLSRAQLGGIPASGGGGVGRIVYQRSYNYEATGLDYLLTAPVTSPAGTVIPPFAESWTGHNAFLLPGAVNGVSRGTPDALGRVAQAQLWTRPTSGTAPAPVIATLQHNALGQLVRIERNDGVVVENFFQPGGLRYAKKVSQAGTILEYRHYVYDPAGRLLEEYDHNGGQPVLIGRYFYLDSDAPFAADLPDTTGTLRRHYYLRDDQQSVIAVADRFGVVEERIWYDPFGQPVIEPRDDAPPVIKRVIAGQGGTLLVELSEPVTAVVPDLGLQPGIRRLTQSYSSLIAQPAGTSDLPELVPGFPPYSVIVFTPESALTGAVQVAISPGKLTDDWDNHVASIPVSINATGTPGTVYYTAPGNPVTDSGTVARSTVGSPFLFHGQYFDYETGLSYLRARFYDVFSGSFLEPDPMGYEDSVNLYAAMGNNPTSMRDPSGLSWGSWGSSGKKTVRQTSLQPHFTPDPRGRLLDPDFDSSWTYNPNAPIGARGKGRPVWHPSTEPDHWVQHDFNAPVKARGKGRPAYHPEAYENSGTHANTPVDAVSQPAVRPQSIPKGPAPKLLLGPKNDWALNVALKAHNREGYQDVIAHGGFNAKGQFVVEGPNGEDLDVSTLASLVTSHPDRVPGMPIRLLVCSAAKTDYAQRFAGVMQTRVMGASTYIWPDKGGGLIVSQRERQWGLVPKSGFESLGGRYRGVQGSGRFIEYDASGNELP